MMKVAAELFDEKVGVLIKKCQCIEHDVKIMYAGMLSIIKEDGAYYPIEWETRKIVRNEKGEKEALYQGVISQKDTIKESFHNLRKKIEKGENSFVSEDWSRMKKLLETIVFAFK